MRGSLEVWLRFQNSDVALTLAPSTRPGVLFKPGGTLPSAEKAVIAALEMLLAGRTVDLLGGKYRASGMHVFAIDTAGVKAKAELTR